MRPAATPTRRSSQVTARIPASISDTPKIFIGVSICASVVRRVREGNRNRRSTMRFMVIVKSNGQSEASVLPHDQELAAMGRYNDELVRAGVMLAGDGLHPSSRGARVKFPEKKVIDGPFSESKELVAGFWIWQVKSKEEAIEWLKRAPFGEGEVELRQIFELNDFEMSTQTREQYDSIQDRIAKQQTH
jgi:hypothetical protein